MTVRVEFCGVPASGKSTLCAGTLRVLKQRGSAALGRSDLVAAGLRSRNFGAIGNILGTLLPRWRREVLGLPHSLNDWHRFVIDHPDFVSLLHRWLAETHTDDTWRSGVFYSLLTSAFEYRLAEEVGAPVLMDEGFSHRLLSMRGYRGLARPGDAALYAAAMPLPSALVLVTAPPDLCVKRVRERPYLPLLLQGEPEALLPIRFAEGNTLLAGLATELERRAVPVLRVDGAGDPGSTTASIAAFVEGIL